MKERSEALGCAMVGVALIAGGVWSLWGGPYAMIAAGVAVVVVCAAALTGMREG